MTEAEFTDYILRYGLTKALDGIVGKDITAFFEAVKNGGKERVEYLIKILKRSHEKAEHQGKDVNFQMPARIAERIINEGSYCADQVMHDYYAGILLSSQEDPFNDAGVFYLSTINRLSSHQLRAHYVIYQMIKETYHNDGPTRRLLSSDPTSGLTYVLASEYLEALYGEYMVNESQDIDTRFIEFYEYVEHALQGLKKENLIKSFFTTIDSEEENPNASSMFGGHFPLDRKNRRCYYFFSPTAEGIQLFMWGQGYGKLSTNEFLKPSTAIMPHLYGIEIPKATEYRSSNDLFKHSLLIEQAKRKFND